MFFGKRICKSCKIEKSVDCYQLCINRKRNNTVSLSLKCKQCRTLDDVKWKKKNPIKAKAKELRSRLRAKYNLEVKDYELLLVNQGGVCAVCKNPPIANRRLDVDHDHSTGKVRALLCSGCNGALGKVNDNPNILRNLANYIEYHRGLL